YIDIQQQLRFPAVAAFHSWMCRVLHNEKNCLPIRSIEKVSMAGYNTHRGISIKFKCIIDNKKERKPHGISNT
ncbi:hypothetical protein, partial [Paenibacillus ihuae]|uniref:hypothetical protein n=1 Tax=Paenibacillus ihuae TaxID=1232431 RepID=UPI001ADEDF5F